MSHYTASLEDSALELDPADEEFAPKLREICASFRDFGTSLSEFLAKRYGIEKDPSACLDLLQRKFRENVGSKPRGMEKWFTGGAGISRKTAFQLVFALDLDVTETNDFFRRIYLDRSFNCHDLTEAVYYFCRRHHLDYKAAKEILSEVEQAAKSAPAKDPKESGTREVLYTSSIQNMISSMTSKDQLVQYLGDNYDAFTASQESARLQIRELWGAITEDGGLAKREAKCLLSGSMAYSFVKKGEHPRDKEEKEEAARFRSDVPAVGTGSDSVWSTLSQIFGLDRKQLQDFGSDRSLKQILKDNSILHAQAQRDFPDRDGIEKALNGAKMSDDRIRRILVFLGFYAFWTSRLYDENGKKRTAQESDGADCYYTLNRRLLEAGFQSLYFGNPYDWIFLWSMKDEDPLGTFRYYLGEVYAVHLEETEEQ